MFLSLFSLFTVAPAPEPPLPPPLLSFATLSARDFQICCYLFTTLSAPDFQICCCLQHFMQLPWQLRSAPLTSSTIRSAPPCSEPSTKPQKCTQVRAYDDRAWCRNIGIPYKRAYALSSYALAYVALISLSLSLSLYIYIYIYIYIYMIVYLCIYIIITYHSIT